MLSWEWNYVSFTRGSQIQIANTASKMNQNFKMLLRSF